MLIFLISGKKKRLCGKHKLHHLPSALGNTLNTIYQMYTV